MTTALQDIDEAFQVGALVRERIAHAEGNTGLGRQVANLPRLLVFEYLAHGGKVAEVGFDVDIGIAATRQLVAPGTFDGYRVIVVDGVIADNTVPLIKQATGDAETDESRSTGDEDRSVHSAIRSGLVNVIGFAAGVAGVNHQRYLLCQGIMVDIVVRGSDDCSIIAVARNILESLTANAGKA